MHTKVLLVAATSSALMLGPTTPLFAGADVTAPSLAVPPYAKFVVGQQLSTGDLGDVRERVSWEAADDPGGVGLEDIRVWDRYTEDATWNRRLVYRGLGMSTEVVGRSNSIFTCSGYRQQYFQVTARDFAGNSSTDKTGATPRTVDQTGIYLPWSDVNSQRDFDVVRSGNWDTSNFDGWINGTTWKTRQEGASVSYTRTYEKGQAVGLVMPTGPERGEADIFVDNTYKTTIDTNSPSNVHRVLTFQTKMPAGSHTLKIVNRATVGHPKIDIDAVVYNIYGRGC
ncbi:MAG TPA: hypothetical protein VMT88_03280 [Actinomycetes bacterium]|nr:hypothetical protein [Actinomycetes bacterium]